MIAIIGAGLAGLGIGWRLARRGHEVTILERDHPGAGASTAAAGMLAPTAEVAFEEEALLALNQASLERYPDFVAALEAAADMQVDYRDAGTLVVGLDRDDTEALDHLLAYQRELGLPVERLSGAEARALEPSLSPNVHSAVLCERDHQVDPERLVEALARAFERAGGQLRCGAEVTELWVEGERARGCVLADQERLEADRVVVAAGAWTRELGGVPRRQLPRVRPVRGQMLALAMEPAPICERVIRAPDAYLVPRSDGRLIIGATMEEMGFDDQMTAGGVFELLRGAWEAMPGIYDLALLDGWTGFRPITLSNEPVLGPSQDIQGLWFATGHGRNGVLLTPITAALMAQALEEGELPEALRPFAP